MKFWAMITLALGLATGALAAENNSAPSVPNTLVNTLNAWLDAHSEYPRRDAPAQIKLIEQDQADHLHGVADRSGGRIRGLYDADSQTLYLTHPWSPDTPRDVSILLHELVHHRQASQHWYCAQAQEWRAYQLQAQWLAEHQIADNFYWPAILLQSSCAKRDIHPE